MPDGMSSESPVSRRDGSNVDRFGTDTTRIQTVETSTMENRPQGPGGAGVTTTVVHGTRTFRRPLFLRPLISSSVYITFEYT